jgi:hypothetical protein
VSVLVSKDDAASLLLDLFRIQAGHLKQIIQVLEIVTLSLAPFFTAATFFNDFESTLTACVRMAH